MPQTTQTTDEEDTMKNALKFAKSFQSKALRNYAVEMVLFRTGKQVSEPITPGGYDNQCLSGIVIEIDRLLRK